MREPKRSKQKITLRAVRVLGPDEWAWDEAVTGFYARRQQSPAITYGVFYRTRVGRQRWYKIGRHGAPWTPEMAREEARRILGAVAGGADPAAERKAGRKATTVAELCDAYMADAAAGRLLTRRKRPKKPSTLATDKGRIERHVKPLLGRLTVAAVSREDVERMMYGIAEGETAARIKTGRHGLARITGGRGAATRTVGVLGAIFQYAIQRRMRPDNPVHGIVRFADGQRDRRLSDDEYAMLGAALREAEASRMWLPAVAAVRFLALTGWRSGEATGLRRAELDLARRTARLADTKSGRSVRPLPHGACDALRSMTLPGERVFPASRGGTETTLHLKKFWLRIAALGGLPRDVTLHVLRHSFASVAADLGYSESTIAALVGHKGHSVTSRYLHSADAVLLAAADAVADRTTELMGEAKPEAEVLPLRAAR